MSEQAIDEALSQELEGFKGSWVAIDQTRNRVVASGSSLAEAKSEAMKKGVADPLLYRVPSHPELLAFY